jgi:hypothetical protein
VHHATFNHRSLVHFYNRIFDIADDSGFRLNLKGLDNGNRPDNGAIGNQMGNTDSPLYAGMLTKHQS